MNLYFTNEIRNCLDLFGTATALNDGVQIQIKIRKISRRRPRSADDTELGHFTFLFCRGRQRNVQRFLTTYIAIALFIEPFVL